MPGKKSVSIVGLGMLLALAGASGCDSKGEEVDCSFSNTDRIALEGCESACTQSGHPGCDSSTYLGDTVSDGDCSQMCRAEHTQFIHQWMDECSGRCYLGLCTGW